VSWSTAQGAEFYVVRYGLAPDRMFEAYQIYGSNDAQINALNAGVNYYFTVEAVNASGITPAASDAVFLKNPSK
jgi:hypothetical protein